MQLIQNVIFLLTDVFPGVIPGCLYIYTSNYMSTAIGNKLTSIDKMLIVGKIIIVGKTL